MPPKIHSLREILPKENKVIKSLHYSNKEHYYSLAQKCTDWCEKRKKSLFTMEKYYNCIFFALL